MLGTRTKQVNSYGRRGSRIVNVSDRRDRESVDLSDATSDVDAPPTLRPSKRENAIIISPTKPRVELRRFKVLCHPSRNSPVAQNRNVPMATRDAASRRTQPKLKPNANVRQPLTPLRTNGTSPNDQPSTGVKVTSKASIIKPSRTNLKPRASAIAVDIMVFDEDGKILTQERRLSHTEAHENQGRITAGRGKKVSRVSSGSPRPIVISDDSDVEVVSPKLVPKLTSGPSTIVISSDESEADDKHAAQCKLSAKSLSRPKSLRVPVVTPSTLSQRFKAVKKPASPPPPVLTPPRTSTLPSSLAFRSSQAAALAPPIPIAKPRQLTPIRGSSGRSVFGRVLATPSTPTEADLSLDFTELDISDATEIDVVASMQPKSLLPLLDECAQASPYEFSAFIETFPFDPIVQSSGQSEDVKFRKIGEASYSEVFGIGDVVLKIIPIQSEVNSVCPETAEIPAPSDAKDILKEIIVTRETGEICDKFVKLLKTYVVRGRYPSLLLDLWDEYNERRGSESIRPDSFGLRQVYAIIILPNGGPDLESFSFKNMSKYGWHQACGIFWQVARALERVEDLVHFEHRDLHWGQILVKSTPVKKSTGQCLSSRLAMDDVRFGVKITVIDLGLSRMNAVNAQGSKAYWTPLDDEIFEGEGDYQYDIYRMMRDLVGGSWKSYHPFTNVMWLHYLVKKLLHEKRLKIPSSTRKVGTGVIAPTLAGYNEQECYECLVETERLLSKCIASVQGQKTRRKTVVSLSGPKSAGDVIAYGILRGWVE